MKNLKHIFPVLIIAFASCKPAKYAQLGDGLFADIQTTKGDIIVKLYHEQVPVTVANFVSLAEGTNPFVVDTLKGKPFYDVVIFHRVIKDFMIQTGDPTGTGSGGPGYKFDDEIRDSLTHDKPGTLSMANAGPGTNGSQFFITHVPTPHLNGKHTVFGEVVQGMETVDSIANAETIKGGFKRDRPFKNIVMKHVEIVRNGKAAKAFDAVAVMRAYFDEVNKREEAAKKVREALVAEFESQKAVAEETPSGLKVFYSNKSGGEKPQIGQKVMVNYAGFLADGTLFDTSWLSVAEKYNAVNIVKKQQDGYVPYPMICSPESRLIPGFREGLLLLNVGDKVRLFIPSALGYGPTGSRNVVPPDADLVFDLEIVEIVKE
ncbi:MAG: peptidylprolyl isomerase [Sinomicrobium sp.]|nr:peptidylprolyl isomerase [Sinomicrobium sp.]